MSASPAAAETAAANVHGHRLLRDVLIYGAGGVGLQLLLSLAVPLFTRIFTTEDYGVIETTYTVLLVLSLLASLGLESASQRSYFDYGDDDERERVVVLSTAFWVLLGGSGVMAAVTIALRGPIAETLWDDRRYALPLGLAAASVPLTILAGFFLEILRMRRRPGRYITVAIVAGLSGVLLALLFAGLLDRGLTGYYTGFLLAGVVATALGFSFVHRSLAAAFDREKLRVMLAYGLPLVPVGASMWVLQFVDRFFLLEYTSLSDVGLYGVGVRLANLLLLGVTAFSLAWSPFMLELHRRDPELERAARGRVLTLLVLALCFGAVGLSVYAHEALRILTPPAYHESYKVVGLLAGSIVLLGVNAVSMSEISLKRRTLYFTRYAIYAALLNVALNFALIPPFGIVGAAAATLLTYVGLSAMYYWRAQRLEAAPFELRAILIALAVTAALIAVGTFVNLESLWLSVVVKLPLLLAFPLVLRVLGVLPPRWIRSSVEWGRTFVRQGLIAPEPERI